MHHVAWGILCVVLGILMLALWAGTQSLQRENTSLKKQLSNVQAMPVTCRLESSWKANTARELTMKTTDGDRQYIVHLPDGLADDRYYPLLLFYPGKGATASAARAAYGLDTLPAIVVYPSPTVGTDGFTAWQGAPYSSSANDVSFTDDIIKKLQSDLCIDRTRIYAAGMSNGGGFASILSCKLPNRFAAYAIVAGALYYPHGECKPPRPTPVISIHSDVDPIVPYNGSLVRQLPPIYDWTAMRAQMNECRKSQDLRTEATTVTTIWSDCTNNATVQNVRIHGGGHQWGQVPNNYLWQFLSQFKL